MAAFAVVVPFKYAALFVLFAFLFFTASDGCTSKSDCEVNQVCCNHKCVARSSCADRFCSSDSGCSTGEKCCNNECVYGSSCLGHDCMFDSECSSEESCCGDSCVSGSNCIGQSCFNDYDCSKGGKERGRGESCCDSVCKDGSVCLGSPCSTDSVCGKEERCCEGICQHSADCHNTAAVVIAGSVAGSVVFICMIFLCVFLARRRHRTFRHGRVVVGQTVTRTAVITTSGTQSNSPHQEQVPSSYQQGHPYHSPPQCEHQQNTTGPPPYNPGTVTASEQSPPYTAEPQGGSGGVYAPKPSYGTVQ